MQGYRSAMTGAVNWRRARTTISGREAAGSQKMRPASDARWAGWAMRYAHQSG